MKLVLLAVLAAVLACAGKAKGPILYAEWLHQTGEETGVVARVGPDFLTVRLAGEVGARAESFSHNDKTLLTQDGVRLSWKALAPGMPVRVSYDVDGSELARVEVLNGDEAAHVAEELERMRRTRGAQRSQTP